MPKHDNNTHIWKDIWKYSKQRLGIKKCTIEPPLKRQISNYLIQWRDATTCSAKLVLAHMRIQPLPPSGFSLLSPTQQLLAGEFSCDMYYKIYITSQMIIFWPSRGRHGIGSGFVFESSFPLITIPIWTFSYKILYIVI